MHFVCLFQTHDWWLFYIIMFLFHYDLSHVQVPYGGIMAHWNMCVCVYTCMYVHFKHSQYTWQRSNDRAAELHEVVKRFNHFIHFHGTHLNVIYPFPWEKYGLPCTDFHENYTWLAALWMFHSTAWLLMNIIITPYAFMESSCAAYYPDWMKYV
jgi:hypothetical protein